MKWNPQPKDPCTRPDCDKPQRQWGFCVNHAELFRRNGVPYRQDEISEMGAKNKYEQHWDRVIAEEPPAITWIRRGLVWIAESVNDPHAESKARREWEDRMAREDAALAVMEREAREVAARFERHRVENTSLMQAARTDI